MALARYFRKAALSAASLLRGMDYGGIQRVLDSQIVAVRYDKVAAATREGRWALELLINLLSRLYPTLVISGFDGTDSALGDALANDAREINPLIDIASDPEQATVSVVVGAGTHAPVGPTFYVGSNGWIVRTSSREPVGCGSSEIPFGAGAAACLGAAWVFRQVFRDYLPPASAVPGSKQDPEAVDASLIDFTSGTTRPDSSAINIGETFLVGVGAIGNAAAWALARFPDLHGVLHLVDGERLDLSNVQRYVLAREADEHRGKVDLAAEEWDTAGNNGGARNAVVVQPHPYHWDEFTARRGNYRFDRVLLALDSADDRIMAQASLPRWIANAWTQPENLGVSRHDFLGSGPCVACLYLPRGSRKNLDQLVAEAIRAEGPEALMEVRTKLYTGEPIGTEFIQAVAARMMIPLEPLLPFASASLHAFYTRAICGGVLLGLGADFGPAKPAEVPMAFQSAMAGILLAAELVVDAGRLRPAALPARTELNLLRAAGSLALRPHSPAIKDNSGRCICVDDVFRIAYLRKYGDRVGPGPLDTQSESDKTDS